MSQFFPRINPKICSDCDPSVMCPARRNASERGAFWYDSRRQGYCSTDLIGGPWGIPVLLDACPYCHEYLLGPIARRKWEKERDGITGSDATAYLEDDEQC